MIIKNWCCLELGIGTGRIALPLSRGSLRVHGIELSPATGVIRASSSVHGVQVADCRVPSQHCPKRLLIATRSSPGEIFLEVDARIPRTPDHDRSRNVFVLIDAHRLAALEPSGVRQISLEECLELFHLI